MCIRDRQIGGCPVRIHIPEVLERIGNGDFRGALELIQSGNPLPDVTGRVCPQELQCQGSCILKVPMSIGQIEFFLPQREKLRYPDSAKDHFAGFPDPWKQGVKPPIAIVGSGPSGLINAYLLAVEGYPVTVFEAFHQLGGVLRYGIPEFRLPNDLIDDVVEKIRLLGGKFVMNFVVGKTATLQDLRDAGFWKIFVGTGAGLPRFMNVPGEHLLNVMSANEYLTRVNLMQGLKEEFETPLPEISGRGVSNSSLRPCMRFTQVRYSFADMTLRRCSPGTFMKRGRPAPVPTKIFQKPASRRSCSVAVLPTTKFMTNLPPRRRIFSTTSSMRSLGSRNSGMPYRSTPPSWWNASNTVTG